MGNIKTFLNIGFVILCLVMLWYLFTYNTRGRDVRAEYNSRDRSTYIPEDFNNNYEYGDNGYSNKKRPRDVIDNTYEEIDGYVEEKKKSGSIFNRNNKNEQKAREREAELDRIRQEERQTYQEPIPQSRQNYGKYESENPFDRQDTYEPTRRSNTSSSSNSRSSYSGGLRYGSKRFSRDSHLGTYKGPMLNGQPHGFGIMEYDNKDLFIGEYRYGQRHGFGNSIYRRGKSGQVKLRQYSKGSQVESSPVNSVSYGTMRFVNGGTKGTYYGPLKSQEPHGFGYFRYDNGNLYIGAYKNGKRHGAGTMVYADKSVQDVKYDYGRSIN